VWGELRAAIAKAKIWDFATLDEANEYVEMI
jgi:hypothetical protein